MNFLLLTMSISGHQDHNFICLCKILLIVKYRFFVSLQFRTKNSPLVQCPSQLSINCSMKNLHDCCTLSLLIKNNVFNKKYQNQLKEHQWQSVNRYQAVWLLLSWSHLVNNQVLEFIKCTAIMLEVFFSIKTCINA